MGSPIPPTKLPHPRAGAPAPPTAARALHILVLSDRDWTHDQGGGTGTNLHAQVIRWLDWGHRVTILASGYPGAVPYERNGRLTIHRMGGRVTVFPHVIWRQARNLVPDADVVLEVFNGISFLTPLWLRIPRVALIHHIHREHYRRELGAIGRPAALLLETLPLRWLYRDARFITVSQSSAADIAEYGIPLDRIHVNYNGAEVNGRHHGPRSVEPRLVYLGRLKRYKRLGVLIDLMQTLPGVHLDVVGEGDQHDSLAAQIRARGLSGRVHLHGYVDETEKFRLLRQAWIHVTASAAEGWSLAVTEAAACGTPSVGMAVGGLNESILDGETGLLARDVEELREHVSILLADHDRRDRMGRAAYRHAEALSWERTARQTLSVLDAERREVSEAADEPATAGARRPDAALLAGAVVVQNVLWLVLTLILAQLLGADTSGGLMVLAWGLLLLSLPGAYLQFTVGEEMRTTLASGVEACFQALRRWSRRLLILAASVAAALSLLHFPLARDIGVTRVAWFAAVALPVGCLWLLLSLQRGALEAARHRGLLVRSLVWEAVGRLALVTIALVGGASRPLLLVAAVIPAVITAVGLTVAVRRALAAAARAPAPAPAHSLHPAG
jgi:glycosyltransferase involved in cell wall biosynthesis